MFGRRYRPCIKLADSSRFAKKIYNSRKFESTILIASATLIILFVALRSRSSSTLPLQQHLANPIYRVCTLHLRESRDFQYCIIRVNMFGTRLSTIKDALKHQRFNHLHRISRRYRQPSASKMTSSRREWFAKIN